jgi:hypothetical protein
MTAFPGSPRLLKGLVVAIDQATNQRKEIQFQYNPDTLIRRLIPQVFIDNPGHSGVVRLKGPPEEIISLELELDATDQVGNVIPGAASLGVYPKLSALELLVYPKSSAVKAGILSVEAPLTLFVWGDRRIVPVLLTNFLITEQAFDSTLTPIRAKVSLELRVLNYVDLGLTSLAGQYFLSYHKQKEEMANQDTALK